MSENSRLFESDGVYAQRLVEFVLDPFRPKVLNFLSDHSIGILIALGALVPLWVIRQVYYREQIGVWRKFAKECRALNEPQLGKRSDFSHSAVYLDGYRFLYMTTELTASGLRIGPAYSWSRWLYPMVELHWSQISSLTEEPHLLTGKPDWETHLLAVMTLSGPARRTIVAPWNSQWRDQVPLSADYRALEKPHKYGDKVRIM